MLQKDSLCNCLYVHDIAFIFHLAYFHPSINHSSDDARWWSPSSIQTPLTLHRIDPYFIIQSTCSVADGWKTLKWDNEASRKISEASFTLCWGKKMTAALWRHDTSAEETEGTVLKRLDIFSHLCLLHWINYILTSLSVLVSSLESWTCIFALCVVLYIHPTPADGQGSVIFKLTGGLLSFVGTRL